MIYLQLFWAFFQIGLFSFGGGYAALPLISQQVISTYHWISQNTFTDLITISQMTPGPIAVNSSTFVGQYVAHLPGALIATLGCILPSCVIVSLLAYLYVKYKNMEVMKTILHLNKSGITVVMITHYMGEATHADRIIVMNGGKIWLDGTPHEVFQNAGLLKSIGLDVPQSTELMFKLREKGFRVPLAVLTEEECENILVDILSGKVERYV